MFEIGPIPLGEVIDPHELDGAIPPHLRDDLAELAARSRDPIPSHLVVQLRYEEIEEAEIHRLLGYGGISRASAPVGLPIGPFEPLDAGPVRLFPIRGLCDHLAAVAPRTVARFEAAGSMDAFEEALAEEITASRFLVGGVLEVSRFCTTSGHALRIRW
ncbi:MAG: hypothetical protein U0166_25705 [Acidobacteriota bacterium]